MDTSLEKRLWEILVPQQSNDHVEYPLEHHHEWDNYVRAIAGGVTILRTSKGQWVNPEGVLFKEKMIPVRIFCTDPQIDDIIGFTLFHYNQEAVLAYEVSRNVKLVHKT